MTVTLTRLSSAHSNIRKDANTGEVISFPVVGCNLVLFGRMGNIIITTPILELQVESDFTLFRTENSEYMLEVL